MLRYIKVNGEWIDTLIEQKEYGRYYMIVDSTVWYYSDEYGVDYQVGKLEDEKDD